jgi:hypothetical protein
MTMREQARGSERPMALLLAEGGQREKIVPKQRPSLDAGSPHTLGGEDGSQAVTSRLGSENTNHLNS